MINNLKSNTLMPNRANPQLSGGYMIATKTTISQKLQLLTDG